MIAAIYSRKSVFTGKGESIENQIQMCKEYASKNLNISEFIIYEDEGFSGGNINRPEFQKLLHDVKQKKFDALICYRLDRISRNVADFSSTLELLQDNNISFVSIKEQFDTSTPMGKAMVYIASVFAQLERETIAERVRDNMHQLAKTGRWLGGQTPLGFESEKVSFLDEEYKERIMYKLKPVKEELKKAKFIYEKYLETSSIHKVLKYLLASNIKGKNGGDFASMSVNDILRSPTYVQSNEEVKAYLNHKGMNFCGDPNGNGILIYNKKNSKYKENDISEWIAAVAKHKGIISSKDWLQVQYKLDKNSQKHSIRQGTSKRSLLSGVLKCAICGSPMRVNYGRKKKDGTKIYYYCCTLKAHSGKTRCDNPNVRGDYLEKDIIAHIRKLNKEKVLKEIEASKNTMENITVSSASRKMQKEIENKKSEMNALLENLSKANSIVYDAIMEKVNTIGNEIKELQSKLNNIDAKKEKVKEDKINIQIMLNAITEFNTLFGKPQSNEDDANAIMRKRILLETIIDRIDYNGFTKNVDVHLWGSKKK